MSLINKPDVDRTSNKRHKRSDTHAYIVMLTFPAPPLRLPDSSEGLHCGGFMSQTGPRQRPCLGPTRTCGEQIHFLIKPQCVFSACSQWRGQPEKEHTGAFERSSDTVGDLCDTNAFIELGQKDLYFCKSFWNPVVLIRIEMPQRLYLLLKTELLLTLHQKHPQYRINAAVSQCQTECWDENITQSAGNSTHQSTAGWRTNSFKEIYPSISIYSTS